MQIVALLNTKKKGLNNISNPRTQNLEDLTTEGKVFIEFYNYIYKLCHGNNYEVIFQQFGIDDPVIINTISKNLSALAQEGVLRFRECKINCVRVIFNPINTV